MFSIVSCQLSNLVFSRQVEYIDVLGVYVMTVSVGELGSVCSKLMDLALLLLQSVKQLEKSIDQVYFQLRIVKKHTN